MTSAIAAGGTTLKRDGHLIAEITKIGGIEITLATKDVTTLTSADDFREYIGTLFDTGEVPIEGNFIAGDTDGQIALMADQLDKTVQEFILTFPTAITATWTFDALVTKFKVGDYPVGDSISFTGSLKPTGKPTLAIGATTGPTGVVITGDQTGALSLIPTYADDAYEYMADGSADNSVTVTVTVGAGTYVLTVNGNTVESGSPSSAITLTSGEITTITVVATESGKVAKTYVIRISDSL